MSFFSSLCVYFAFLKKNKISFLGNYYNYSI